MKFHDFQLKTKVGRLCQYTNKEELFLPTARCCTETHCVWSTELYRTRRLLVSLLDCWPQQPPALRLLGVRLRSANIEGRSQTPKRVCY